MYLNMADIGLGIDLDDIAKEVYEEMMKDLKEKIQKESENPIKLGEERIIL